MSLECSRNDLLLRKMVKSVRKASKKFEDSLEGTSGKERNGKSSKGGKKIWSFDDLVQAMNPTSEELEFRDRKLQEKNVEGKYSNLFTCTKCHKLLKRFMEKNKKVPIHPCLGVLLCNDCRAFYENGDFSLDSDGEDIYCRWCGEGGTLFTCSRCICGFCRKCLKWHFTPRDFERMKKDENWVCFFCNPKPLWFQRFICTLAIKIYEETVPPVASPTTETKEKKVLKTEEKLNNISDSSKATKKRSYQYSTSNDDSDSETTKSPSKKSKPTNSVLNVLIKEMEMNPHENSESGPLQELQKLIKSSENQMNLGIKWCQETLENLSKLNCEVIQEGLAAECSKIKLLLSTLSTCLGQFCNSIDSLERTLCKEDDQQGSSSGELQDSGEKQESPYTTILQFLGFVSNQIKTFAQKGISFSEILEATLYDDDKVIGLKKKCSLEKKQADSVTSNSGLTNEEERAVETKDVMEVSISSDNEEECVELETDENNQGGIKGSDGYAQCTTSKEATTSEMSQTAEDLQKLLLLLENA